MVKIKVRVGELDRESAELAVLGLFQGRKIELDTAAVAMDRALGGQIRQILEDRDFRGEERETMLLYGRGAIPAKRILLVGLGQESKFGLEAIRIAAATAARKVRDFRVQTLTSVLYGAGGQGLQSEDVAQAIVEGTELGLYQFGEMKSPAEDDPDTVERLTLLVPDHQRLAAAEEGAQVGQQIAAGTNAARDLVNRPSNYATPSALAERAQAIAAEFGLACRVLDRDEMRTLGMHALLGVAQGSHEPPRLIVLETNAGEPGMDTLALVGKGITFDSGGISLKAAESMPVCKGDMAGAAAVLESLRVAAALRLPLHVVGLIPATENMPGGGAYKPGDVVRAMNGKTIEVISTDAEGRLILADALAYAVRYEPKAIIDLATLTNSVAVALGHQAMGLFSNDDNLAARLESAGRASHERVWRLPLFEEYGRQIKSEIADLKNSGGQPAGAITAAMFLQEFVSGLPWAHLDIAGRAFAWTDADKPYSPHMPGWATGVGVRLLVQLMRDWGQG